MNDRKVAYRVLVWRPVRNGPLERHKRRWEDDDDDDDDDNNNSNNNNNIDT